MTSIGEHSLELGWMHRLSEQRTAQLQEMVIQELGVEGSKVKRSKVGKVKKVLLILLGTQQSRHDKTHEHQRVLKFGWWNVF